MYKYRMHMRTHYNRTCFYFIFANNNNNDIEIEFFLGCLHLYLFFLSLFRLKKKYVWIK
jgi:hypothetical protein